MKIIFFGTPPFSSYVLDILNSNYKILAVVTTPDNKKGRGQKIIDSAVKQNAITKGIPVLQPKNLNDLYFINSLKKFNADLFIVVAFRKLPTKVWSIPEKGCINLHTSLLPNYRGAGPINWVLINGEKYTGITTFFINDKIDEGSIILQEKVKIEQNTTAAKLHNILMVKGTDLIKKTIELIEKNKENLINQELKATDKKAPKICKDICKIDWSKSAEEIHNLIRGLSPYISNKTYLRDVAICPGAWFNLYSPNNKQIRLKILHSNFTTEKTFFELGSIMTDKRSFLKVVVKNGFVSILQLQAEGKKAMDIKSFLLGYKINNDFKVS